MMTAPHSRLRAIARQGLITLLLTAAASLLGGAFHAMGLREADIAIVYLLAVHMTARLTDGYAYGFAASFLDALTFNYLFVEPAFSLSVNAPSYIVTFAIMIIMSLVTGTLTSNARGNARDAIAREEEAKALYTLTRRLTDAQDADQVARAIASAVSATVDADAAVIAFDESGRPEESYVCQSGATQTRRALDPADAARLCAIGTEPAAGAEYRDYPVRGRECALGAVRVPAGVQLDERKSRMLGAMIESAALALDRVRATRLRQRVDEEVARERYRANLLRAISHDLRTPLAGIMGTAEVLESMTERDDPRRAMMREIYEDADWLHALVENILGLTRLQEGKLVPRKTPEAAEEVVGAAVRQISRRYPAREISVSAPEELLVVPMDAKLIGQVLLNLLDNAVRHTPPGGEIAVRVARADDDAVFTVQDAGEGIADEDLPSIFQSFYTSRVRAADARRGSGLGLAICDAVVRAHGGVIRARNRPDGAGAEFTFTLPLEESQDGQ